MRSEKLQGFVLKRTNYSEADKIVTIFTKSRGKIKVVGKGVRRIKSRRAAHLELFNEVEVMVHTGRGFQTVTEAQSKTSENPDLKETGYLFFASEVLDKLLPEDQPHPEIYKFFQNLFPHPTENSVKKFVAETLWNLGYLPKGDYPSEGLSNFVESIIEKPLKSKKFLEEL